MAKKAKKSTTKTKAKKVVKTPVKKKAPVKKVWPPKDYLVTPFAKDFGRLIKDRANKWPPDPRFFENEQPLSLGKHLAAVAMVMGSLFAKVAPGQPAPELPAGPFYVKVKQLLNSWHPEDQDDNITLWDLERALDLMLQAVLKALGGGGVNRPLPPGDGG